MSTNVVGLYVLCSVLPALSTLAVGARYYVRTIKKQKFGVDDWTSLAGLVRSHTDFISSCNDADGVLQLGMWGVAGVILDGNRRGLFGLNSNMDPVTGKLLRTWREGPNVEVQSPLPFSRNRCLTRRSVLVDSSHRNGSGAGADQTQCHFPVPTCLSHQSFFPLLLDRAMCDFDSLGRCLLLCECLPMWNAALGVLDHRADYQAVLRRHRWRQRSTVFLGPVPRRFDPRRSSGHDLENESDLLAEDASRGRVCIGLRVHRSCCNTRLHHVGGCIWY